MKFMTASLPIPVSPKESAKNILVRIPTSLGDMIQKKAKAENVSQTALINASLLLSCLAWNEIPELGQPPAVLKFLEEIDRAATENDIAFGAFNVSDWHGISALVEPFAGFSLISDLKTRQENNSTVAFRFELTRLGRAVLPLVNKVLRPQLVSGPLLAGMK